MKFWVYRRLTRHNNLHTAAETAAVHYGSVVTLLSSVFVSPSQQAAVLATRHSR